MLKLRLGKSSKLTSTVKLESSEESDLLLGSLGAGKAGVGSIQTVDVGLMMLSVMESHDLSVDMGL